MEDFSTWYHQMLEECEIIDQRYAVKGMIVYRGWGMYIIKRMTEYLERLLEEDDHEPVYFPVLIPEDVLGKETDHIAGFEEQVFWVTHAGKNELERRLALRPTSETCMYDMFSLWVRAHTDLPIKIHQSVAVYRYETKHTRPLIRGREFLWNEGHTAFATETEAEANVRTICDIYGKLISDLLCLPFEVNQRPEWDKFPGASYTLAFEMLTAENKVLQVATVHNLGQNFSKVFGIEFEDEKGEKRHPYQTSYGPGFGRLLAALIAVHGDEKGVVLPPKIAPIQVIIVPIIFKDKDKVAVMEYVGKIKAELDSLNIRNKIDDGDGRPGAKYYFWEKKGVPVRLEVGPRDLKAAKVTMARRDTGEKSEVPVKGLDGLVTVFEEIEKNLRKKAKQAFKQRHFTAETTVELKDNLQKGIVEIGWCGGDDCAKPIDEAGTILSVGAQKQVCLICGKKGNKVKVARTY